MAIIIKTEETIDKVKITGLKALKIHQLPEAYKEYYPFMYLTKDRSELRFRYTKNAYIDCCLFQINSVYERYDFKNRLGSVRECGDMLHKLNKPKKRVYKI